MPFEKADLTLLLRQTSSKADLSNFSLGTSRSPEGGTASALARLGGRFPRSSSPDDEADQAGASRFIALEPQDKRKQDVPGSRRAEKPLKPSRSPSDSVALQADNRRVDRAVGHAKPEPPIQRSGRGNKVTHAANGQESPRYGCCRSIHCKPMCQNEADLQAHHWAHDRRKPYACDVCSRRYTSIAGLNSHFKTRNHSLSRCLKCYESYSDTDKLFNHLEQRACWSKSELVRLKMATERSPDEEYEDCADSSDNSEEADYDYRKYICCKCDAKFRSHNNLDAHYERHFRTKPFACGHCCYYSRSIIEVEEHMWTHSEKPIYCCSLCSVFFDRPDRLQSHILGLDDEQCSALVTGTDKLWWDYSEHFSEKKHPVDLATRDEIEPEPPAEPDGVDKAEKMFVSYTISEDRTGGDDELMSARLAALGERSHRKEKFSGADLSLLCRQ